MRRTERRNLIDHIEHRCTVVAFDGVAWCRTCNVDATTERLIFFTQEDKEALAARLGTGQYVDLPSSVADVAADPAVSYVPKMDTRDPVNLISSTWYGG